MIVSFCLIPYHVKMVTMDFDCVSNAYTGNAEGEGVDLRSGELGLS